MLNDTQITTLVIYSDMISWNLIGILRSVVQNTWNIVTLKMAN